MQVSTLGPACYLCPLGLALWQGWRAGEGRDGPSPLGIEHGRMGGCIPTLRRLKLYSPEWLLSRCLSMTGHVDIPRIFALPFEGRKREDKRVSSRQPLWGAEAEKP